MPYVKMLHENEEIELGVEPVTLTEGLESPQAVHQRGQLYMRGGNSTSAGKAVQ